jgi:hypothetical protein
MGLEAIVTRLLGEGGSGQGNKGDGESCKHLGHFDLL